MGVTVRGARELRSRFEAIKPSPALMKKLGTLAIAEQKRLVPRKTGNLGRSIGLGSITARSVETVATANYATYVELGTRPHVIRPRNRKVLRFAVGGNARLTGTPRTGAAVVFTKKVKHPGTKPQPYMVPGAKAAVEQLGPDFVIKQWNEAA